MEPWFVKGSISMSPAPAGDETKRWAYSPGKWQQIQRRHQRTCQRQIVHKDVWPFIHSIKPGSGRWVCSPSRDKERVRKRPEGWGRERRKGEKRPNLRFRWEKLPPIKPLLCVKFFKKENSTNEFIEFHHFEILRKETKAQRRSYLVRPSNSSSNDHFCYLRRPPFLMPPRNQRGHSSHSWWPTPGPTLSYVLCWWVPLHLPTTYVVGAVLICLFQMGNVRHGGSGWPAVQKHLNPKQSGCLWLLRPHCLSTLETWYSPNIDSSLHSTGQK